METEMKTASPKKLTDGSWGAAVNNKHNEELAIGDEILIATASGKTWVAEISEIVDAKNSIVRTIAATAKAENGRTCPNCNTEMPMVKKGKGFKKYACTCGCWATQNNGNWYYSE